MTQEKPNIALLFEPRTVAVIGASATPGKIGYQVVKNIQEGGYQGTIIPINPKGGDILGLESFKSLHDVPGEIDLATLVIPAKFVLESVKECAQRGVKFLSIITSGFSEVGNVEEELEIVRIAKENGMRILGPNIFGIYSGAVSLNATFGPSDINRGGVSIITQSGALGIAMIGKTKVENIGLSSIISVGNKCDIDEADLLEYLIEDDNTKVIMMYIEGIKDGERLVPVLKRATTRKPVVAIKSGRSKRGAMAAASHTGSLAGADEVFDFVMKQCGVHRAENLQEAMNWCKYLSEAPLPKGENVVIITNGGGVGVLCADACEKHNVTLYDDQAALKAAFSGSVPSFGSTKNPVDITGGASMDDYMAAIEAAYANDDIHSIIVLGCETAVLTGGTLTEYIGKIFEDHGYDKPIVYSFVGGSEFEESAGVLRDQGVPMFPELYDAVSCMGVLYADYRRRSLVALEDPDPERMPVDAARISEVVQAVKADGRNFLLAHEGLEVMKAADIPMPQSLISHTMDQAVAYAEKIGYPVVMKVVSNEIVHKSDAGGVALNLENADEVVDAYQAIMHNCRNYNPNAKITGIEVVEMVKKGTETIIGARIDPGFGRTIMFGLGGIYVEVMKDVAFRSWPIDNHEALAMIKDIKSYPLLLGVRGEEKRDIDGVVDVLLKVGAILESCDLITDIEINPLVAYEQGDGVKAVDVRILLKKD